MQCFDNDMAQTRLQCSAKGVGEGGAHLQFCIPLTKPRESDAVPENQYISDTLKYIEIHFKYFEIPFDKTQRVQCLAMPKREENFNILLMIVGLFILQELVTCRGSGILWLG